MKIDRSINDDVAVLTLHGEFDSFSVSGFLEEIEALVNNGVKGVVLDMLAVRFIMSTAIGAIVKARKRCKEVGGDLAVSRPSPFVRDVFDSLGISKVIRMFDENNNAVAELGRADAGDNLLWGNGVLVKFVEQFRQNAFGKPIVGRMLTLREDGMIFQANAAATYFPSGTALHLKFRVPLARKSYYFEVQANVVEATPNAEGCAIDTRYSKAINADDLTAIRQFLADLEFLRAEVKKGAG